ncbi:hypothetical protein QJS04_geneDACA015583 [Acorus gramineus]|uniref:La-related protein 6B n=1 Tax=Acorus gramineus TaxID=55184 RepID=A0AAV9AQ14_ACOGR|nr:hypothetical protein QJS04_geneDACA015583 [Acorus gramineus]
MAQEPTEETLETDLIAEDQSDPSLSRSGSFSRLNARAPEFVPRTNRTAQIHHHQPHHHHHHHRGPPLVHQLYVPVVHHQASPPAFEYYGGGYGGGEQEVVQAAPVEVEAPAPAREGLSDEVVQKITKQVEYYFSDANLATTEHLMRFITKDPEGFVPISIVASFKKIKALVNSHSLLADALRTSSKLVVSEDGKKVRRQVSFTGADMEELQTRIVVAENLPEDHSYQNLVKIFSVVGGVKTIRTCYPQVTNGTTTAAPRSSKMDVLLSNKLHAFVEYETVEQAEKAVIKLNDERNWRSGLRVRLMLKCMPKHEKVRGRKSSHEADGQVEEDELTTPDHPNEKQPEDAPQPSESSPDHIGEEYMNSREGGGKKGGRGRGRGNRGRGRVLHGQGQHHHHNSNRGGGGGHPVGTPPSNIPAGVHLEHRLPPGPRMPDGTRGFAMGRGKPASCKLFEGLAKLKLSFQNNPEGRISSPQIGFLTKHLSVLYDLERGNSLVKGSFDVDRVLQFKSTHDVKSQQGKVAMVANLGDLQRVCLEQLSGPHVGRLEEKQEEEVKRVLSINGILKGQLMNGLCTVQYKDNDLNLRYCYKDE